NKLLELNTLVRARPTNHFSSGERVLISVARAVCALHEQTKAIIVDEADAPLDDANRRLFRRILLHLSKSYKVLFVSHIKRSEEATTAVTTEVYSLACDDEGKEGFAIPIRLRATPKAETSPKREGYGNIGTALLPVLNLVHKVLEEDPAY